MLFHFIAVLALGYIFYEFTWQKNYDSFYPQCQIKEMIGEADKDDSGSVDFGERNVFHLPALLLVCLSEKLFQHFCNNIH